ncbi:MAG: ABC transporter permease [Eubacteriales bacterium]|jgi:multidrug/hemolysin transport system permease protein|nr:ABC transporter permease [Eubacteriales bacterium]
MKTFLAMTKRNIKVFFKDKGMFFASLITPLLLLILYATFLAKVYKDSFNSALPDFISVSEKLVNGTVAGELFSSILAVCCVTVAFCSNTLMAADKVSGARKDLFITPVKKSVIALSYYVGTLLTTLIVIAVAMGACFIYIAVNGWFLTFGDVMLLILDVFLLSLFGTAFSCIINSFLKTQGQISAVGTVISAGYGFICGAYMPISNFGSGLQKTLSLLPGTYGTSLIRNHALRGVFAEMTKENFPPEVIEGIKDSVDCNIKFFGRAVSISAMYAIICASIAVLIGVYVLINVLDKKAD